MTLLPSWVESANNAENPFPLNNLPYGVFSTGGSNARCGVAIGDHILDLHALEAVGIIEFGGAFASASWNAFMSLGSARWTSLRAQVTDLLAFESNERFRVEPYLHAQLGVKLHMPIVVSEYTDFYSSRDHAYNVGTMFRGPENALPPNWLHIPIGYNGRASSVCVSGTEIQRPWGQLKSPDEDTPRIAPSRRFDFELELGAIVGTASDRPLVLQEAHDNIFGYVLLNDWSARDIQSWEYQPLGPFQSKATATSISPWIVTQAALEPFSCMTPVRELDLLDYLKDTGPMLYDVDLQVTLTPAGEETTQITRTNYKNMYFSAAQQLAHHTTSGCTMRVGDLLGSGTISGPDKENRGSLLELSWGGKNPIRLPSGSTRSFIEDGDTLTLKGAAKGNEFTVGFGECTGKVVPALSTPYARK